jgi:hypothetical protein
MLAIIAWAGRLLLIFLILKLVLSRFLKKGSPFSGKREDKIKRFKAGDGTVEDADYKEL